MALNSFEGKNIKSVEIGDDQIKIKCAGEMFARDYSIFIIQISDPNGYFYSENNYFTDLGKCTNVYICDENQYNPIEKIYSNARVLDIECENDQIEIMIFGAADDNITVNQVSKYDY